VSDARPLVMHLVYSFDVGGLENGVVNLINRMPAKRFRHAVVALTHCAPAFCQRITRADVEFLSLHKPPGHGIKLYPRLYRLFRERRPAVVHTRNLAALECVVPARLAGVPARVHGEHGWDVSDPQGTRRKFQWLRRAYSPFVSRYVALSGHIESYLVDRVGIASARVERICNGVDTERFFPAPDARRMALPGSPFDAVGHIVVGTVGRLQAVKDQITLVRAFALARGQGGATAQALRLLIAGDGPLRGEVEAEIRNAGLGSVVWLAGERKDVSDVMRSLDMFVLPSRTEGISNTILEAMASGLPVLATAVGGNAELVVPGHTGALVVPADPGAMANALMCYADDAALRHRCGVAGRQRVEQGFSLDAMVARYTALYEGLLSSAVSGR
jgi:sugar transferase (PEP-CTERM/EpsH1 system associated)